MSADARNVSTMAANHDEQRRKNQRLAWILVTVALAFGAGFVAKVVLFGA